MFWGLIIEPGKRYAQTVDESFHVSMASLEPNSPDNDYVSVMLDIDNQEYVLCNLHKHKGIQCQLDLNFRSGKKIALFAQGKSRVHLTGYVIEEEDLEDITAEMSDDMEEEMSPVKNDKKLVNSVAQQGKRKPENRLDKSDSKKAKLSITNEADSDEDDDEDDDFDEDDDEDVDAESEEEEDDDDLSMSEDDDSDDMAATQVQKTPVSKKDKLNKTLDNLNKTPTDKMNKLNKTKTPMETQEQKKKKKSLGQTPQPGTPKTPSAAGDANGSEFPTPHPSKKKNKKLAESPAAESPKPGQSPVKKTLQGGVNIHDLKVGDGPVAKAGKRVTVYYVGRLKQNNKQFDATTQGPGFKFQLGGGEVIKGWDIGVAGMRVGGKRRIVCPPHMAYGNKGSPPAIPPNSSLVFEVELRSVN